MGSETETKSADVVVDVAARAAARVVVGIAEVWMPIVVPGAMPCA